MKNKALGIALIMLLALSACGTKQSASGEQSEKAVAEAAQDSLVVQESQGKAEELSAAQKETAAATVQGEKNVKGENTPKKGEKSEEAQSLTKSEKTGEAQSPAKSEKTGEAKSPAKSEKTGEAQSLAKSEKTGEAKSPAKSEKTGETKKPAKSEKTEEAKNPTNAENTAASTKPSEEVKPAEPDEEESQSPAHTSCTWDGGSVTAQPTCGGNGVLTYTCTVCGATTTESIPALSHNFVSETLEATCTEPAKTVIACSLCKTVQSEEVKGEATGHDWQKHYWPEPPNCEHGGFYNVVCDRCGALSGESGSDAATEHTPVTEEIQHGNCSVATLTVTTCSGCGWVMSRDAHFEDDHDWVSNICKEFNAETDEWENFLLTYCSRCEKILSAEKCTD